MNEGQAQPLVWAAFAVCLAISFVLSGMEAGLFALSRLRIRQQMRTGRKSARLLHQHLENSENFLWTILVGNTLANFAAVGWLVVVLHEWLGAEPWLFAGALCATVFLFYALFDLLPKMLFRMFPNRLCLNLAQPFGWIHGALGPLVGLVQAVSNLLLKWRGGKAYTGRVFGNREELRQLMQESGPGLSSDERAMINRVLDLQTLTVRQVMVPIEQAASVEAADTVRAVFDAAQERHLTRLPVWGPRDNSRRVIGLVNLNALLYRDKPPLERPVAEFVAPALFLDEDLRLELALRRLQRSGERLAIVLSRDRREIGILSLQDILKTLFGEVTL